MEAMISLDLILFHLSDEECQKIGISNKKFILYSCELLVQSNQSHNRPLKISTQPKLKILNKRPGAYWKHYGSRYENLKMLSAYSLHDILQSCTLQRYISIAKVQ